LNVSLSRENFNIVAKDIIDATFTVTTRALEASGLHASEIDNIIMVGGGTNIPLVRDMVQLYFGRTPFWGVNPDEVVALGAAIQGAIISGAKVVTESVSGVSTEHSHHEAVLLDVTPLSLGVGIVGARVEEIIPRNTPLPTESSKIFTTAVDEQDVVKIQVYQGESKYEEENQMIGVLSLTGLRRAPRGEVEVEVTFEIDVNGILSVSAMDLDTGQRQEAKLSLVGSNLVNEADMKTSNRFAAVTKK